MSLKESKPFSNGSEWASFNEEWCCNCKLYKIGADAETLPTSCVTDYHLTIGDLWPGDIIQEDETGRRICLNFQDNFKL